MLLFKALVGSHAYGTNIETSDRDYIGVFIQEPDDLFMNGYKKENRVSDDEVYYELGSFVNMLLKSAPNAIELLFSTEENIKYCHEWFRPFLDNKNKAISKQCGNSFFGYAMSQIKKATALDKYANWEKGRTIRKTPLDFCTIILGAETKNIKEYLTEEVINNSGLSKLDKTRGGFALFLDLDRKFNFKGVCGKDSNELVLSSIPLEWYKYYDVKRNDINTTILSAKPLTMFYNEDAYKAHCRDYNHYAIWLKEHNNDRYKKDENGIVIDVKNLMHCVRLVQSAQEMAATGTLTLMRENINYLLKIRRGLCNSTQVLKDLNVEGLRDEFFNSDLQDLPDRKLFKSIEEIIKYKMYEKT